jgi:electron transfer flavoprotein beta subunit
MFTEPRYASLPNIMAARKKPIEKIAPQDLGIDLTPRLEVLQFQEPPKRVGGGKVSDTQFVTMAVDLGIASQVANVDELITKMKEAGIKAVSSN